jgi:hypothetical protein
MPAEAECPYVDSLKRPDPLPQCVADNRDAENPGEGFGKKRKAGGAETHGVPLARGVAECTCTWPLLVKPDR